MSHFHKKLLCILLASVFVFLLNGCTPLSGSTEFLDAHPVEELYAAYSDFYYGKREVDLSFEGNTPPDVNAIISSQLGTRAGRVDISFANRSPFEVTLYGYAWITEESNIQNSFKTIYYNEKENVSNASYTVKYQSGHGGIAPFNFIDKVLNITPDTIVFIFFSYRGTDYAAGVKSDNNFIYWPLSQTNE